MQKERDKEREKQEKQINKQRRMDEWIEIDSYLRFHLHHPPDHHHHYLLP